MTPSPIRPPDVHIEDLAHPTFTPPVAEMLAAGAAMADTVVLEPDALLDQAVAETGLDDFGEDGFREPLDVVMTAFRDEAGLSAIGRVSTYAQLLQFAKNRLLIEDLIARHPEITTIPVERPIIIAGLPRTGTTHLHNLIAADPGLRSLPYWESIEPVLADNERPAPGEPDPRLARTEFAVTFADQALPYLNRMHEMTTWHVHEEIHLLAIDFSTMFFDTIAPMPSWREYYKATDQTPHYAYLERVLQVLQYLRGGTRWILKTPQHLEQFGPLMTTFPDATVVVTHRDPVSVTSSLCTLLTYTARLALDPVDPVRIGAYWSRCIEEMLATCAADRHLLPADQSIDVLFDEFMADDLAMVARIYELADQPMTSEGHDAVAAYLAANPRGRHGRVRYDLADFGLDATERYAALAPYIDRFGVEIESPVTS